MNFALLKQVNESVLKQITLIEAIDTFELTDDIIAAFPQTLIESAEAMLGRAFAQIGAGKNISDEDASLIMGLYSLGDPNMKDKTLQQITALRKGGIPLLVALQLAGDDAGVSNVLRQAGKEYVQASGNGNPYQIQTLLLHGNVLDQNQRAALGQRLQKAQTALRNAAAAMQASQQQKQKTSQTPATPQPKTAATTSGNPQSPVRPMNLSGGSGTTQGVAAPAGA